MGIDGDFSINRKQLEQMGSDLKPQTEKKTTSGDINAAMKDLANRTKDDKLPTFVDFNDGARDDGKEIAQVPKDKLKGKMTTQAVGEEGGSNSGKVKKGDMTTQAVGEEGGGGYRMTTQAVGEEGGSNGGKVKKGDMTTQAVGEEGGGGSRMTTCAVGEEGGKDAGHETTLAVGEEGGGGSRMTTCAVGEEGGK